MTIVKDDTVKILTGKDRGKTGTVVRVLTKTNRVVVDGINLAKKHMKPTAKTPQGGIIQFPAPLHRSNVMVICGNCGKPTKVHKQRTDDGTVRICRLCQAAITPAKRKK